MLHKNEIKILQSFLSDVSKKVYGRNLAKEIKMSQKNVAILLNKLEKENIFKCKVEGKNKYFFLNKENKLVLDYLVISEIYKKILFFEKYKKVKEIFEEEKGEIVGIFGSYVKGNFNDKSDLDVFVFGKFNEKKLKEKGKMFGVEVSVHKFSLKKFKEMVKKKSPFANEILKNHILIKGYETFVREVLND
jgi:predicted nucleotidyltransferase